MITPFLRSCGWSPFIWLAVNVCLVRSVIAQAPVLVPLNTPALWQRLEYRVDNVPAATNRFNSDLIRLDAVFTLPSGLTMTVPGFWYQGYNRSLSGSTEQFAAAGSAQWRIRFTPPEIGDYNLSLLIYTNGMPSGTPVPTAFSVPVSVPTNRFGNVRVAPGSQYFETSDGRALRLIGHNVCWSSSRGTYDYDVWFNAMQANGENFTRLWFCPWALNLEHSTGTLENYRLDTAWKLDYILQLAEQKGIYVLLCLDHHGMFRADPAPENGNNFWSTNPYNSANGGPCVNENAFFTNLTARALYQKRLRYLIGRYGYSQNLLGWEFFNEIDNIYPILNANNVAAWHGAVGSWLRTNDPFGHLITTSLTGSSDRPEIWNIPQIDFANYHSYGEASPATRFAQVSKSFLQNYGKPVVIGEFGVSSAGWNRSSDPYLRGFRQALWGGALGGSAGTAQSWWWESIHGENVYPVFGGLAQVLNRTGWGIGGWTPIGFTSAGPRPTTVGAILPGGTPFNAQLPLGGVFGDKPNGAFAVTSPDIVGNAAGALNAYVHGQYHPELRVPFKLSAWLTNSAKLVMRVGLVSSSGSQLRVRQDGTTLLATNLAANGANYEVSVGLSSGNRLIEITNAGLDWVRLDWVRLEQVLPSAYPGNWQPAPEAVGLRGSRESLVYLVAPNASYPGMATNLTLPIQQGATTTLTNWSAGRFFAEWYNPANGAYIGSSQAMTTNGSLPLPLPDFREDLAGIVYRGPTLTVLAEGEFRMRLESETGGKYVIERTTDFSSWLSIADVTNVTGVLTVRDFNATNPAALYRAKGIR